MSAALTLDDARSLYQDTVLDRARHPRHAGRPARFTASGIADNRLCGDKVHVFITRGLNGTLDDIRHETRGCAICLASADLMAGAAHGRSAEDIRRLAETFAIMIATGDVPADRTLDGLAMLAELHAYKSRHRCATLPWESLRAAMEEP